MGQFFVSSNNVHLVDKYICITGNEYHHIVNVIRKSIGEKIKVFTEKGNVYNTEIIDINNHTIKCKIIQELKNSIKRKIIINLYQAILKPKNMDLVIQKATELSVNNITAIFTRFSVCKITDMNKKISHWEKIIISSVKQSDLSFIPNINIPIPFNNAISVAISLWQKLKVNVNNGLNLLFYEKQGDKLAEILYKIDMDNISYINLFIGPEGGFTEQEISFAQSKNVMISNLGKNILRSETASISVISSILFWLKEL